MTYLPQKSKVTGTITWNLAVLYVRIYWDFGNDWIRANNLLTLLKIGSIESWDSQLFKTALDERQTILEKFSASTIFLNSHLLSQIFCIVEAENFSKIVCHSSRAFLNSWGSQLSIEPILGDVGGLLASIQSFPIRNFSLSVFSIQSSYNTKLNSSIT